MTKVIKEKDSTALLLSILCDAHAPSGFEGPVREILKREWQELSLDNIHQDKLGNLYGTKRGQHDEDRPRILLMAHMDEVGFLIREITDNGMVLFDEVGGWLDEAVTNQRFIIQTPKGPIIGYTGIESGHIIPGFPATGKINKKNLFLDVGAKDKQDAIERLKLRPGLPITPDTNFQFLNSPQYYLAKALDDRVGLAVMIDVLKILKNLQHPNTVLLAATVQEEVGMRGAKLVYKNTKPDIVINLEISVARDFPKQFSSDTTVPSLGKGPSLFVYDNSTIPSNNFINWSIAIAKKYSIPHQFESSTIYTQDACCLQQSGHGMPVLNFGLPVRYPHTQSGVMNRGDYDALVKLITKLIVEFSPTILNEINNENSIGRADPFQIINQNIIIDKGREVLIKPAHLQVTMGCAASLDDIRYTVIKCTYGTFFNSETKVFTFSQTDINHLQIRYVHDGGTDFPEIILNVSDGISELTITPTINFCDCPILIKKSISKPCLTQEDSASDQRKALSPVSKL